MVPVFEYLSTHGLKSKKNLSYIAFVEVYNRLSLKHHLDPVLRAELKLQASMINPDYKYKSNN